MIRPDYLPKMQLYNFVLFMELPKEQDQLYRGLAENEQEDNGILTYCYIDRTAGLSYEFICWASVRRDTPIIFRERNRGLSFKIREGSLNCPVFVIPEDIVDRELVEHAEQIRSHYGYFKEKAETGPEIFSEFRHPLYPNDVLVNFYDADHRSEAIWVRIEKELEEGVVGRLMNEPFNPRLGFHSGERVGVTGMQDGGGTLHPIAIMPWMKELSGKGEKQMDREIDEKADGIAEPETMCNGIEISMLQRVYSCTVDVGILEFQPRADHCLRRAGINTIGELARQFGDLKKIRNCGDTTIAEIREKLHEFIDHYAPEPQEQAAAGPVVRRQPIRHGIIMKGHEPKFLTCFGGSCLDMCRAQKIMQMDCVEYSLGQYSVKVPYEGRPRLYVNGEAMPAVMSRL